MTLFPAVSSGTLTFPQFCVTGRGGGTRPASTPSCWELIPRPAGLRGFFSNSDDHLLKNIELFDKLSLRFNGRVLFIKDVIGDEICCWSFYGQGRKLAEVCCTSIVYATEKKQTKVRGFPLRGGGPSCAAAAGSRRALGLPSSADSRGGAGQGRARWRSSGSGVGMLGSGQLRGGGCGPARDSVVRWEGPGLWSWPNSGLNSGSTVDQFSGRVQAI